MKHVIILFSIIILIFSCNSNPDWNKPEVVEEQFEENLRGTYKVKIAIEQDTTTSNDELVKMGENFAKALFEIFEFNITFENDGKAIIEGFGEKNEGTWEMKGNKLIFGEEEKQEFIIETFDGNFDRFLMHQGDTISGIQGFLFTKLNNTETKK
jgi:hypothetical protein